MALPENQPQSTRKLNVWNYLDVLLRVIAFFFGLVFLAGYHRFSKTIGFSIDMIILSHAVLMFLCVATPSRPSRAWLTGFLVAAVLASIHFIVRELPGLQREYYPLDIVLMDVAEFIIAIWFIYKYMYRNARK